MALLILFGFIAGAATAVSPCVLPVLPVALAAGATGGRRRPIGIVAGLTVSRTGLKSRYRLLNGSETLTCSRNPRFPRRRLRLHDLYWKLRPTA